MGGTKTKLQSIWTNMRYRCANKNHRAYARYGGRGITVSAAWNDFETFANDMGPYPGPGYSLDRIDNDSGYSKENCRWSTRAEQARNRHNSKRLTMDGQTRSIDEWSKITGIDRTTIRRRLDIGWTIEDALTRKLQYTRKRKAHSDGRD